LSPQQELDGMKILNSIYQFLEDFGRARAAMHLANLGDREGAKQLMMEDFRGWI